MAYLEDLIKLPAPIGVVAAQLCRHLPQMQGLLFASQEYREDVTTVLSQRVITPVNVALRKSGKRVTLVRIETGNKKAHRVGLVIHAHGSLDAVRIEASLFPESRRAQSEEVEGEEEEEKPARRHVPVAETPVTMVSVEPTTIAGLRKAASKRLKGLKEPLKPAPRWWMHEICPA